MVSYEITAEMNLEKIIAESREVAQALNEFADNLEQIKEKYAEPQKSGNKQTEKSCNNCAMEYKCLGTLFYGEYWCWKPKTSTER